MGTITQLSDYFQYIAVVLPLNMLRDNEMGPVVISFVKYRSIWCGSENHLRAVLSRIGAVNFTHIGQVAEMTFRKRTVS